MLVVSANSFVGLGELLLVFTLLQIHLTLSGHVACGDNEEHELVVLVEQRCDLVFHIAIQTHIFQPQVMAGIVGLTVIWIIFFLDAGHVEQIGFNEVAFALLSAEAYLSHLLI